MASPLDSSIGKSFCMNIPNSHSQKRRIRPAHENHAQINDLPDCDVCRSARHSRNDGGNQRPRAEDSAECILSTGPVIATLEVPAGTAGRLNLQPADKVIARQFPVN
jgi:hypothetical protein